MNTDFEPAGAWKFEFNFSKKDTLQVRKYQAVLLELRAEFEPQFNAMSPEEGKAEWTTNTDGKAPSDNMFAQFTYKCIKSHLPQGPEHGTWTLLWNPKKADIKNHLHARCAPPLFKELSNQIQMRLAKEFNGFFVLKWKNGISGYDNCSGRGGRLNHRDLMKMFRFMNIADTWSDSERCPHHLPWGYCSDCTDDVLEMNDLGYF